MDNTVCYKTLVAAYKKAYQASGTNASNLTAVQKVVESSEKFDRRLQQNYTRFKSQTLLVPPQSPRY